MNRPKATYTEEYLMSIFSPPEKTFRSYASSKQKRTQASKDLREAIEISLKGLPMIQAKVIMLRYLIYFENKTIEETSELLGKKLRAVKYLKQKALERMKLILEEIGRSSSDEVSHFENRSKDVPSRDRPRLLNKTA